MATITVGVVAKAAVVGICAVIAKNLFWSQNEANVLPVRQDVQQESQKLTFEETYLIELGKRAKEDSEQATKALREANDTIVNISQKLEIAERRFGENTRVESGLKQGVEETNATLAQENIRLAKLIEQLEKSNELLGSKRKDLIADKCKLEEKIKRIKGQLKQQHSFLTYLQEYIDAEQKENKVLRAQIARFAAASTKINS
jgi:hypothetical protein